MEINDNSRRLIIIDDKEFWDKLDKSIRALPVYCRRTETGFDFWPMWPEHMIYPTIRVSP